MQLTADKSVKWQAADVPSSVTLERVFFGPDPVGLGGFQVAVATCTSVPSRQLLRDLFLSRKGKTQIQLVVAALHDGTAYLFGPDPQAQAIELPLERAHRQLQSVLAEPDLLAATERYAGFRRAGDSTGVAGFTNSGLFASHHITSNVPHRPDWETLGRAAMPLLSKRGNHLIEALGFGTRPGPNGTMLLSISGHSPRAVAVLLDDSEHFDSKTQRFQLSPVAFGLAVASRQDVPWLVVLRKDQVRLYPGRDGVGVGSKGQSETFFEIDLATVDAGYAALLPLIFSSSALAADGTAEELLRDSARYATELGARLRERIYGEVIPTLAVEVAHRLAVSAGVALDAGGLALSDRVTLRILFRLLFQAYAEDRGLLPSGRNEGFDANSLKTNARRLIDADEFGSASTIWFDLVQVWNAIDEGNPQWQVPPYNGGLFASDKERSPEGALIRAIELPDTVLGPALKSLLIDVSNDGILAPVDFRSLSVREFGTIYEGLLESSLSLANQDLTVDSTGTWVPATRGEKVLVPSGAIYFHTASGERKATGSYFTPKMIVDHLIERSITPALADHLGRIAGHLDKGDASTAAREFFDFRVADLAMGSGHFLVAAVDKIEALMRTFLTEHSVPGVNEELLRLAVVARDALGTDDVAKSEVDEVGLLRRQIARRCIYGLDINPMAVELARLALWIHTFVPGLPMSNLDHGLVNANSLTGIGTIEESVNALVGTSDAFSIDIARTSPIDDGLFEPEGSLFAAGSAGTVRQTGYQQWLRGVVTEYLDYARPTLADMANAAEATKSEVEEAATLLARAQEAAEPARRIFDAAVAVRLGEWSTSITRPEHVDRLTQATEPRELVRTLRPAHMPYLFPEVFLRDEPGFDVILGNPPWEELQVEEPKFWLRIRPGLLGLKPAELQAEVKRLRQERSDLLPDLEREVAAVASMRKVLLAGPFPGLGTGDIDLYQAFAWRSWQLLRTRGHLGVVMPRSLVNSAGSAVWRETVFPNSSVRLVGLVNTRHWVFAIHPQWSITLMTLRKAPGTGEGQLDLSGPFHDESAFVHGKDQVGHVSFHTLALASAGAAVPNLPDAASVEIFAKIRQAPRLDAKRPGWDFRPVAEFHATNDRSVFDSGLGEGGGRIPVIAGAGFNLWQPETGEVYAWADPARVEEALFSKRQNQSRLKRSAFYGLPAAEVADRDTLPFHHPRIAFRDVCRATDTRTCIAALIPARTVCQNSAPYLLQVDGGPDAAAYLLGVLSSIPLDWYSRRFVELHMNLHIFNGLPVPAYDAASALCAQLVQISARLAAVDDRFGSWARDVGVPEGSVSSPAEREGLIAELDALVSLLYGLNEDQLEHVFATFHRGWSHEQRLAAVLNHYREWKGRA